VSLAALNRKPFGLPEFAATATITGKLIDQSRYNHDKAATGNDHKMGGEDVAGVCRDVRRKVNRSRC
jgi:hypothetical protein